MADADDEAWLQCPVPPASLKGDACVSLDCGQVFSAHTSMLHTLLPQLRRAVDRAHWIRDGARPSGAVIHIPSVTPPQMRALLQAIYQADELGWAGQQPLKTLQYLAEAAHAVASPELLQLADGVLAAGTAARPEVGPAGPGFVLKPQDLPAVLSWARGLGLQAFAAKLELAIQEDACGDC